MGREGCAYSPKGLCHQNSVIQYFICIYIVENKLATPILAERGGVQILESSESRATTLE